MSDNHSAAAGQTAAEPEKDQIEEPQYVSAALIEAQIDGLLISMTYNPEKKSLIEQQIAALQIAKEYAQ